jgi:hypothetical protein
MGMTDEALEQAHAVLDVKRLMLVNRPITTPRESVVYWYS